MSNRGEITAHLFTSSQVHHNFASAVVINNLKFRDVTVLHHHSQELDDNLAAGSDEHLALASLLGTGNVAKSISEYVHANHCDKGLLYEILSVLYYFKCNHVRLTSISTT